MRVLAYEHITGGGLAGQAIPRALAAAGDMMLGALIADLVDAGVEVITTRDVRLPAADFPARIVDIQSPYDKEEVLGACARESDAVWPIAPEAGGVLERFTERLESDGLVVLNSRASAIRVASSKLDTASSLVARGIPVVPTFDARQCTSVQCSHWVLKPDDGAGCEGTRIVNGSDGIQMETAELDPSIRYVAQPFVIGTAVSLSLLCEGGRVRLLACNRQQIAMLNDRFCLLGCEVNDPAVWGEYAAPLAAQIVAALPGLWGYAGVDLLFTDSGPRVLEVNPRLTLSYVGLSASLGVNVAKLVLGLLKEQWPAPDVAARRTPVTVNLVVPHEC